MTNWLWAAGSLVIGERIMSAGGGYEFNGASAISLARSGFNVRTSAAFSIFDPADAIAPGNCEKQALVEQIAADKFRPSRKRPFAIQSVGCARDLMLESGFRDLQDGGVAQIQMAIGKLQEQGLLQQRRRAWGWMGAAHPI